MRIRVLWIIKGLGLGGAERLLAMLPSHFDLERFEIDIAYVLPWKDALVDQAQTAGARVHCLGSGGLGYRLWPLRLARWVRREGYHIIHTHSPLPGAVARLAAPRSTGFVHTEHSVWPRYRAGTRMANALTYGRNSRVFAVSEGVAASIRRSPRLPVEVLYHGIDTRAVVAGPTARTAARLQLDIPENVPVVGTVGSLSAKKDQLTLLKALTTLRDTVPDVQLVIIGGGPLETDLRRETRNLGMENAVTFLGIRHDAQQLLPAFDVFALTSIYEGLPLVLIEAMAAGLPCVATAIEGVTEVVADGVEGVLVPARDHEAVSTALAELLADSSERAKLGRQGQAKAVRFSLANAATNMQEIYDTLAILPGDNRP